MAKGIVARFLAGDDPADLARERCDRLHGLRPYWSGCGDCLRAVYAAIRRDHRRAKAGESRGKGGGK